MTKKLLIIDDSSFIRMLIKKIVKDEPIELYEASNGKEAFALYEKEKPDLVTLDITMPGENGLDLLVELKNHDPHAKIIMCSSMIYKGNVQEALEKGAIGFMVKPFRDEVYLETIRKYI